ncbi:MAG: flagellar cap protein, partial [Gammaproteobacteria bacterium]|nr:flagellar cap protein [Gammaproteobacteria bacterium]
MAPGAITSLGLGSGLDLQNILDQLKEVDETRITVKADEKEELQSKVDAYNTVNVKLFSIKSDALNLSLGSNYLSNSVSLTDEDILSATIGDGYAEASYSVDVVQKAQRNSWQSTGVASKTDAIVAEPSSGIADPDTTGVTTQAETLSFYYGTYQGISTDNTIAAGATDATFAINGVNVGIVNVLADDADGSLVDAINFNTDLHGVTASVESGILTLTSADHSDITVTMDAGTTAVFGGTGAMSNTGQQQIDVALASGLTFSEIVDEINTSANNIDDDGNQMVTAGFALDDNDEYYIRLSATSGGNSVDSEISVSGFDWVAADTTVGIGQGDSTM